jgi:hypothetical protein
MRTALQMLLGAVFSLCAMLAQAADTAAGGEQPSSLWPNENSTSLLRFVGVIGEVKGPLPADQQAEGVSRLNKGASYQDALSAIAAPDGFKKQYNLLLDTPDGMPQLIQDRNFHENGTPVVSSAGIAVTPTTISEGYILEVNPGLVAGSDTTVELELRHLLPEPGGTSLYQATGSKTMAAGDWQVLTWEHAGKHYAMLLQLESISPI